MSILPYKPTYISDQSWTNLLHHYGSADDICRVDGDGKAYVDVDAMDALVETTGAVSIVNAWQQLKQQFGGASLHQAQPQDAVLGWRGFMSAHRSNVSAGLSGVTNEALTHQQQTFMGLMQHPYHTAEDAWAAAKNIEIIPEIQDLSLAEMTDYLSRLAEALTSSGAAPSASEAAPKAQPDAAASVGQCFVQAGLWFVIVFFVALVAIIVGVVISGGGLAAVAAAIVGILIASGIWATLGGIIALVICLGGAVGVQINY